MIRRIPLLVAFLLASMHGSRAMAQTARDYAFSASLMYGPFYSPGEWHPVRFTLRNETEKEQGGFAVIRLDRNEQPVRYMVPVRVRPHSRLVVTGLAIFTNVARTSLQDQEQTVPPVGTALWESGGGVLAGQQHEIIASPAAELSRERSDLLPDHPTMVLGVSDLRDSALDSQDVMSLRRMVSAVTGRVAGAGAAGVADVPRERTGYGSFRVVVLDLDRADDLDRAQQIALLDNVRTGGILIVAAPTARSAAGNWISPYLPVDIVGQREATSLNSTAGRIRGSLKLLEPVPLIEGIPRAGSRAIVADESYAVIADQPLGLGRIVFMGVPVNALLPGETRAVEVWRLILQPTLGDWNPEALLGRVGSSSDVSSTGVGEDVLGQLIGRPVPALRMAAGIAIGYLAAVLILQLLIRGPARPKAFVAALAIGVVLAGILVVISMSQRGRQELLAARLSVADVGAGGGGLQRDVLAYVGKDQRDFALEARSQDTTIRPLLSRGGAAPDIWLDPMRVPAAEVFSQRITRIWQAEGQISEDKSLTVECRFGPNGAAVTANNRMGQTVTSPLLVWGGQKSRMDSIAAGDAVHVGVREANAWNDFTNPGVVSYDTDRLRGQFLKAVIESSSVPPQEIETPYIAGWIGADGSPSLVRPSTPPVPRAQVLVRSPVTITPSPVGTSVVIPPGFVRMESDAGFLPILSTQGGFNETSQTGEMLIGFAPPWQAGKIDPTQFRLTVRLSARDHVITFRRGQVSGGAVRYDPDGAVALTWNRESGEKSSDVITLEAGDADKEGRVWLAMVVTDTAAGPSIPLWRLEKIAVELRGTVAGPPAGPRPAPVTARTQPKAPPQSPPKTKAK